MNAVCKSGILRTKGGQTTSLGLENVSLAINSKVCPGKPQVPAMTLLQQIMVFWKVSTGEQC